MRPPENTMSASDQIPLRARPEGRRGLRFQLNSLRPETRRALPVIVPVTVAGGVALVVALSSLATSDLTWSEVAGMAVLLGAAVLAEAFPVPIEGVAVGSTSLATIFLVAVAVIYGAPAAAVVGFLTMTLVEVGRRRPLSRILFNCGVYALAGTAAGVTAGTFGDDTLGGLVVGAILAGISFYLVDITLLALVVSRTRRVHPLASLRNYVLLTAVPFAIMASLTVILVVLWDRSPFVAVVLVGPLLATALYQRWIHRALERLRQFDRLKDEFIAVVSHELRTPLTSVYGAAMTLGQHELDEERRNALLRIVSTESERLARLLDDILCVSRLDSGRSEVAISPVEPLRVVNEVVDSARTHLPSERSIELTHPSPPPPVAADPDKLRQVLVNLIDNALKYASDGSVEVRVEPYADAVRFSVSDRGPGIPFEDQTQIFEKFHRLDPNMTKGAGGTGLGLYICRELVDRMEGRIWVESEPGDGSTFSFELPLAHGT
jgi:signal transduction histidine kinase